MVSRGIVLKFSGWKAVAVLALAAIAFSAWHISLRAGLKKQLADGLKTQIVASLMRPAVDELKAQMDEGRLTEASAAQLARLPVVEITGIEPRGFGSRVVVRVTFSVDGEDAGEGVSPKYFVARHSWMTGWVVLQETGALSYRLGWL